MATCRVLCFNLNLLPLGVTRAFGEQDCKDDRLAAFVEQCGPYDLLVLQEVYAAPFLPVVAQQRLCRQQRLIAALRDCGFPHHAVSRRPGLAEMARDMRWTDSGLLVVSRRPITQRASHQFRAGVARRLGPGVNSPKGCLYARVDLGGPSLLVVAVHMSNAAGGKAGAAVAQARELRQFVDGVVHRNPGCPLLVAGDLNVNAFPPTAVSPPPAAAPTAAADLRGAAAEYTAVRAVLDPLSSWTEVVCAQYGRHVPTRPATALPLRAVVSPSIADGTGRAGTTGDAAFAHPRLARHDYMFFCHDPPAPWRRHLDPGDGPSPRPSPEGPAAHAAVRVLEGSVTVEKFAARHSGPFRYLSDHFGIAADLAVSAAALRSASPERLPPPAADSAFPPAPSSTTGPDAHDDVERSAVAASLGEALEFVTRHGDPAAGAWRWWWAQLAATVAAVTAAALPSGDEHVAGYAWYVRLENLLALLLLWQWPYLAVLVPLYFAARGGARWLVAPLEGDAPFGAVTSGVVQGIAAVPPGDGARPVADDPLFGAPTFPAAWATAVARFSWLPCLADAVPAPAPGGQGTLQGQEPRTPAGLLTALSFSTLGHAGPDAPRWHTYFEVDERARRIAAALAAQGLRRGDSVGLHAGCCAAAMVAHVAVLLGGLVSVPLAGDAHALRTEIDGARCTVVVATLDKAEAALTCRAAALRLLIVCGAQSVPAALELEAADRGIRVLTEDALLGATKGPRPQRASAPQPDAPAARVGEVLEGQTGADGRRGAFRAMAVDHRRLMAAVRQVAQCNLLTPAGTRVPSDAAPVDPATGLAALFPRQQRYLATQPLSHDFELVAALACLVGGHCVGFAAGETPLDVACRAVRPTVLCVSPALLFRLQLLLEAQAKQWQRWYVRCFHAAWAARARLQRSGRDMAALRFLFFRRTAAVLGGRVRTLLVPSPEELPFAMRSFARICIAPRVRHVTFGATFGLLAADGVPPPGTRVALSEGLAHSAGGDGGGYGEALIASPAVLPEARDEGGWARTGIVAAWRHRSLSPLCSRDAVLWPLPDETVVAPQLEREYLYHSPLVQTVFVTCRPLQPLVAVVVPVVEAVEEQLAALHTARAQRRRDRRDRRAHRAVPHRAGYRLAALDSALDSDTDTDAAPSGSSGAESSDDGGDDCGRDSPASGGEEAGRPGGRGWAAFARLAAPLILADFRRIAVERGLPAAFLVAAVHVHPHAFAHHSSFFTEHYALRRRRVEQYFEGPLSLLMAAPPPPASQGSAAVAAGGPVADGPAAGVVAAGVPFAVDIGGTVAKVAYLKAHSLELPDYCREDPCPPAFAGIFGPGVAADTGLHFLKMPTARVSEFVQFLSRQPGAAEFFAAQRITRIPATGGGALRFNVAVSDALRLSLHPLREMECLVRGVTLAVHHAPESVFQFDLDSLQPAPCALRTAVPHGPYPILVCNIGSGVSIVKITGPDGGYQRVGGSPIGGGTFWGLVRSLTDVQSWEEIADMTRVDGPGDNTNVDLLVGDIYGFGVADLPARLTVDTVASTFGKLGTAHTAPTARPPQAPSDDAAASPVSAAPGDFGGSGTTLSPRPDDMGLRRASTAGPQQSSLDVVRSLLLMIATNVTQIVYLTSRAENVANVVFTGGFVRDNEVVWQQMSRSLHYWSSGSLAAHFLHHDGYLGSMGALAIGAPQGSDGPQRPGTPPADRSADASPSVSPTKPTKPTRPEERRM